MSALATTEADAYTALYQRYCNRVLRECRVRLGPGAHQAEDIAQETWARAWSHMLSGKPTPRNWLNWLLRVAVNLCIDDYRHRSRLTFFVPEPDELDWLMPPGIDPERIAVANETAMQLYGWLERLQPRPRRVIIRHYFGGLEPRHQAQRYGDTRKRYSGVLYYAHRRLRVFAGVAGRPQPAGEG